MRQPVIGAGLGGDDIAAAVDGYIVAQRPGRLHNGTAQRVFVARNGVYVGQLF